VVDLTIGYQKLGFICVVVTYSASVIIKLIKMFHSKIFTLVFAFTFHNHIVLDCQIRIAAHC